MVFLKNLLLMLGLVGICLFFTFNWMKSYTKHGKSYNVDKFIGMQMPDALDAAKKHEFNLVILDSTYIFNKNPGLILEQNPAPGSKVKENRTIYVSVTKAIPDEVELPDLVGNYDATNYTRKLQRKGLKSQIAEEVFDEMLAPNTILYVKYKGKKYTDDDITKGIKIPEGETIDLIVTKRSSDVVDIPDLKCMQYSEAKFLLSAYNLAIGSVVNDATVKDEKQAYVWKQQPGFYSGKMIKKGAPINLFLTQFRPDNCN